MGMAASQARYLGLTARKTNCEWEGQQINQARTALANQSANLFNQMLALSVPDCPDKTDFTTIQYSYTDGNNKSVLDNWRQLSDSTKDYNYVVDHYYYADIYTGSKKLMSDPQVTIKKDSSDTTNLTVPGGVTYNADDNSYSYKDAAGKTLEYGDLTQYKFDAELQNAILDLVHQGYIKTNEFGTVDTKTLNSLRGYHDGTSWHFAKVDELENAINNKTLNNGYADLTGLNITEAGIQADTLTTQQIDAVKTALGLEEQEAKNWLKNHYKDGNTMYNIGTGAAVTEAEAYSTPSFKDMTTTFNPT